MVIDVHDHPSIDTLLIGIINFDDLLDESSVGNVNFGKSIGECKIFVYSSEGPIPHFHIKNKSTGFDCCVRIYSSEYFSHGSHIDKLTKTQASILNDYLKSHDPDFLIEKWSIWNSICALWKKSNPECIFPNSKKIKEQPDYSKLA